MASIEAPSASSKKIEKTEMSDGKVQFLEVAVPPDRFAPLERCWMEICIPIYEMKIDIGMNLEARKVELKTRADTPDVNNLPRCAHFVHACMLGFDVADAVALLRFEGHYYVDSFEISDVHPAIGMLLGEGGRRLFAIENSTRTRIVIAESKIHVLGSYYFVKLAESTLRCIFCKVGWNV